MIYGIHAVKARISKTKPDSLLLVDHKRKANLAPVIRMAKSRGIKIEFLDRKKMDGLINGNHQGVALKETGLAKSSLGEGELFAMLEKLTKPALLLILDEVTDPHNLGACLRTADAVGVDGLIVPKDRSCGLTPAAIKVASGAAESVNLYQVSNLARVMRKLADERIWLIGLDDKADENIYQLDFSGNVALVLGSEGSGLRRLSKEICQQLAAIPMNGAVNSLNVSVATAVILYEALRQRINY